MSSDSNAVSHTNAVRSIVEAAQQSYQALLKLQALDDINPDGILVDDDGYGGIHPQKAAHSYLLGYHYQLSKKSYTVNAQDYWQESLAGEDGETYTITVPSETDVSLSADEGEFSLDAVETTSEELSLENMSHRWAFRYITITREVDSPYDERGWHKETQRRRLWLPPRALHLAFEQLEDVRAKINLAAEIETPGWHSQEPI